MIFLLKCLSCFRRSELICDKCGKTQVIFSDLVNFKWSTEETVKEIRFRIEQKTGLTASAGDSFFNFLDCL